MSAENTLSDLDWEIRSFVYRFFIEHGYPPAFSEAAEHFSLDQNAAQEAYLRLHRHHQLFLRPGTRQILMANPLSAVATNYRVITSGRELWANCAWDSLGIPAMCHSDAQIEARDVLAGEPIQYQIQGGRLVCPSYVVHFSLPVREWYDDLIHT